jgi:hypothetical protein
MKYLKTSVFLAALCDRALRALISFKFCLKEMTNFENKSKSTGAILQYVYLVNSSALETNRVDKLNLC